MASSLAELLVTELEEALRTFDTAKRAGAWGGRVKAEADYRRARLRLRNYIDKLEAAHKEASDAI